MKMKIGIIGGGNMGQAIISGIFKKFDVFVCEKDKKTVALLKRKFNVLNFNLKNLVTMSDVIVLAVKPQDMEGVLEKIAKVITKDKIIISIAAGITTSFIEKKLGSQRRVIRTMPNMPAQIGEGITAVCNGRFAKRPDAIVACNIFDNLGKTVIVKEELIDSITAVSGSGPAYVFYFIENLVKASKALGLDDKLSKDLVRSTVLGSVHLLEKQKESASTLRAKVTSKGGTTQAALDVFLKKKIDKIYTGALKAAKARAKKLSKK